MSQSFIRIGSSRALTVPAGEIRKAGFGDDTVFDFSLSPRGIEFIVRKEPVRKIQLKPLSARMQELINNPVEYEDEEIEQDERLRALVRGAED